jgi:hypothetical protein
MEGSGITDRFMWKIKDHLLPGTEHFNRVYEVFEIFLKNSLGLSRIQIKSLEDIEQKKEKGREGFLNFE